MKKAINIYFGICPKCVEDYEISGSDLLNIERSHFMVCKKHRTYWGVGQNLFSCWRHEGEKKWERNARLLATCDEVNPVHLQQ